jgi:hypothetical protein
VVLVEMIEVVVEVQVDIEILIIVNHQVEVEVLKAHLTLVYQEELEQLLQLQLVAVEQQYLILLLVEEIME